MATKHTTATITPHRRPVFIPDPPKHELAEMTTYEHISATGNAHYLIDHFGNPETTLVKSDRYLQAAPGVHSSERRLPDLLIAFDADPELYKANNAYVISEQGKPPDFVLEVASPSTARRDLWENAGRLPRHGHPRVLAVRRDGRGLRRRSRGRPAGGRGVPPRRNRDAGRRCLAGLQPRAQAERSLGTRRTEVAQPEDGPVHRHVAVRTRGSRADRAGPANRNARDACAPSAPTCSPSAPTCSPSAPTCSPSRPACSPSRPACGPKPASANWKSNCARKTWSGNSRRSVSTVPT